LRFTSVKFADFTCEVSKDNWPRKCQQPFEVVKNTKSIWLSAENVVPLHAET